MRNKFLKIITIIFFILIFVCMLVEVWTNINMEKFGITSIILFLIMFLFYNIHE